MSRKKTNKIEAETGEVVQSNRPFIIRNGGIAKPLGQGLYLLGGKTHEQGGIDIDFTGDARIFSAQPILNGNSPAELVARGANPNITFNRQERFKDVNRINDDGSRKKAENGKEIKVIPTREEYITSKIDSTINNSLKRSLNKTVPDLVYVPITESNYSSANAEIEFEQNNINKFSVEAAKAANNGDYGSYYKYMNDAQISSARLNRLTSLRNKGLCEGPNCIYNATKNYGDEYATTGNYTFMENHDKKGFIKIDSSSKRPGDIVQVINDWNNAPSHAMTYYRTDENGVDRFNYSNGNSNKQAIRKDGKYPVGKGTRLDYYRFVGTPADSVRWTNEYNELYMNNSNKKRLGGSTGLIRVQANGKDRLMYVPFTGEETKASREKAKYGTRRATDGNRFMSYDRASYLLNLNKGNNINIIDDKVKEKINDLPSERDIKPIERDIVEKENLEFINGNKTEAAPKPVGKSYHNISASNSSAVARGIARKLNYNFSDHGSTDFRTADLNNAIFTNRPDTVPTITSIYGNDFVAPSGTLGSTRRAIDFRNENESIKIDNKIPVDRITRYYGNNKQGDFIIGDLSSFKDDDYVAAVRNKSMPFNDVVIKNGKLYYLKDGQIVESSLPEGENNKHIVYNSKTGKKQFVSTTKDVNKLYDFYKQFLTDNEGLADIVLLDNGRFEDNIYKGGRPLTDEEISDYYRNDFNRGFDKVPVLISGKMKKFGGKVSNRTKANLGLEISSNFTPTLSYLRTHPYSSSRDVVVDVMTGETRTLDFADPYRPNKTYGELLTEGYFDGTGFTTYGRRINYNTDSNDVVETTQPTDNVIKQNSGTNNTVGVKANVTIPRFNASEEYKKHLIGSERPEAITLSPNVQNAISRNIDNDGYQSFIGNKDYTVPMMSKKQERQQTREALKKEGLDWVSRNKNWAAPAISALSNSLAGLLSYRINKNMLGNMKYADKPIPKRANPLITRVDVEPKLTNLRENLARSIENITANASSSRVSQSRINDMALNTTLAMNAIYADKENQERDLINKSRLNQQEVANANIDAENIWRKGKSDFENAIRDQESENAVLLVDNINKGIQTTITDAEKRRQFRNNLAVMAAAYPNVTPALLRSYGVDFLRMGGKVKLNKKK